MVRLSVRCLVTCVRLQFRGRSSGATFNSWMILFYFVFILFVLFCWVFAVDDVFGLCIGVCFQFFVVVVAVVVCLFVFVSFLMLKTILLTILHHTSFFYVYSLNVHQEL